jgi:hypothetical protein
MKARQLIDEASFDPEVVKAMGRAFDEAWNQIAANFGREPKVIEDARMRLAEAMVSVADQSTTDVQALKDGALQQMAMDYQAHIVRSFTQT